MQQFESKFFELIKYHRENVKQMEFRLPSEKNEIVVGHKAIVEIYKQLEDLYSEVFEFIRTETEWKNELRIPELAIPISYVLFFYGVPLSVNETIRDMISEFNEEIINKLWHKIRERRTEYDSNIVYYGGHQHRLGH